MTIFGLNQTEIKNGYERAEQNPDNVRLDTFASENSDKNFFSGAGSAAVKGIQSGAVNLMAATNKGTGFDFGLDMSGEEFQKASVEINKGLQPNPDVTGWLGSHMIFPLTKVFTEVAPTLPFEAETTIARGVKALAGASIVGGTEGSSEYERLKSEGVDESTAMKIGAITGVTQAAGFVVPAGMPGNILTRAASGLAINTPIGMAQRGATGKVLEDAGYSDMADQYKVLDKSAILTDMILGAAFGALHSAGRSKKTLPSDVDTALAGNNINQYELDSAPGIPADPKTRNSHIAAMDAATRQALNNEQVNVADHFNDPNFLPKSVDPSVIGDIKSVMDEEGISSLGNNVTFESGGDKIDLTRIRKLTPEEVAAGITRSRATAYGSIFTPEGVAIKPTDKLSSVEGFEGGATDFAKQRGSEIRELADLKKQAAVFEGASDQVSLAKRSLLERAIDKVQARLFPGRKDGVPRVKSAILKDGSGTVDVVEPIPHTEVHPSKDETENFINETKAYFERKEKPKQPLLAYLKAQGGVKVGSVLDGELRARDITPTSAPGLFKRDSGISDLDNIPADEFRERFGLESVPENAGYVDRQYVIDALEKERSGKSLKEEIPNEDEEQYHYLAQELDRRGISIMTASNEEILRAIKTEEDGQAVIPGAEQISDKQLAERKMEEPLGSEKQQKPANEGLFDVAGRDQQDFVDESLTREIIAENPELNIMDEDGNVISAKDAMAKADEELALAQKDSELFQVAANCFIRNGHGE